MDILRGALGLVILLLICYLLSANRKSINWITVSVGVLMQLILAVLMLKVPFVRAMFQFIVNFFVLMINSTNQAAVFLFGDLAKPGGTFGFAFSVLPTIVFFSALSSLLYYLGILQRVVYAFAWLMNKTMRLSGAESLAAAANVFIGQTEAPLVIKPYLERMTRSEIMCLMTGGMATIAGGVFGAYMAMLGGTSLVDLDRRDECCGFGGTFAITEEAVSVRMGMDKIADHQRHGAEVITGTDVSCLMHLEGLIRRQGLPLRTMHIAELLNARA